MVNLIWVAMAIIGIVFAMFHGTMNEVNEAIFKSAKEAVTIAIGMISILVFWLGLMRIAEEAGLLERLSRFCKPLVRRLFPEVPPNHPALGYIVSNMIANMFGLGNAATPMGIKAMEELKKLNGHKDVASRSMVTFLAINTSSITLIPATVISIRMTYGSASPGEIIGTTLVASTISTVGAVLIDRYYYWKRTRKGGKR
ncbi:spore maturation protein [Parageobacillus sp. VR-IP]|jgi:spore maturation protein A|uniref:nucleoside recognition domain-containing protein n=1 Tax=Anoxybacillaceae TaxID=3120669 RepID=UPI00031CB863|nr:MULTISPECIES: nucleoside recognition domain-containing protein [Parageobacillus]NUK31187.1 spore maturation protein [Parageobacillus sp. VR-IP]OQP04475.1 spore maturation protein [Geobacillus sp. 44B]QNU36576.1 spore maturation protein [Geobacillus sp. 44B]